MKRVLIVVLFGLAVLAGIEQMAAATGLDASSGESETSRIGFT